ncbi:hypothetical protein BJF79_24125 [Actinomadura sp. CNU-125]|uniref:serine/threonine-protein kinase n=1 Tax=Actinomadura sp. CNU-125 TaxID=1904961 RepID=UPI0009688BB0|nr:serine/threonine-protein kinase [Actinomadura sp. CNU-125]OLT11419.1 hypothetical protein BJF79_24125 [Actinomadura sp. CNU-125]
MESPRRPEQRTAGPYRLERRLGGGALGEVFAGRSPDGRTVAVRLVRPELAADPGFRRRLAASAGAARRVDGPSVARLVDVDTTWLACEYVEGLTLRETVELHGPLPPPALAALASGLARGLAALHGRGVLHHDLKPSNVILAEDGPRLIDFGLAGLAARADAPSFASPEQVLDHDTGPPSDVFALGSVLAFAGTGRAPFGTGPAEPVRYRVGHAEPDLSGLPADLADLVAACLAKDPVDRPAVAEILERLSSGGEVVYVRNRRWQMTAGFKGGLLISWLLALPLLAIPLMLDLETIWQIVFMAALTLGGGAFFALLGVLLPPDRVTLRPDGLTVYKTEDKTIRWDVLEQVALVGDGDEAELVVWYAGDDRPVDGPERHGGTVVCKVDDVVAPEDLPRFRAALARFAGDRHVELPAAEIEPRDL